jgi:hypothetical protein
MYLFTTWNFILFSIKYSETSRFKWLYEALFFAHQDFMTQAQTKVIIKLSISTPDIDGGSL